MIDGFKRVLVLSPHPDDAEIGAGATIARLTSSGCVAVIERFSRCAGSLGQQASEQLIAESKSAASVLGASSSQHDFPVRLFSEHRQQLLNRLIEMRDIFKPDAVLVHAHGDQHQDHEVVRAEAIRAFRCTVLGYEAPWSNSRFSPQLFVRVGDIHAERKVEALDCYKTQAHRTYMGHDVVRGALRVRGMQCGARHAEAFEVLRAVA